ncbi:MAG: HAD-IB family hydrolase [Cellulosilyticaceae bacterium]
MGNSAAFFDIDGTIYREGLITEVFKKMIKYDLIDGSKWHSEVRPAFLNWDKRQGDYDTYLLKMVDVYKEAVKGISPFHMRYVAQQVIAQKGDRVYTYSRQKIKWHKGQGHQVIAISGSPLELVREMSNKYGMDDFRGTIYEVDEMGAYSGEITPMWDAVSKRRAILEMVEKYDIDLTESYAYGDTAGDFTMLSMVGHPFAINPTKELLSLIQGDVVLREKITVIVERKDVTYRLQLSQLDLV